MFDSELAYKTLLALCKIGPRVSGTEAEIRAVLLIEEYFRKYGLSSLQILGHEHQYYDAKRATIGLQNDSIVLEGVPCWMSMSTPAGGIKAESMYIGSHEMVKNLDGKDIWNKIVIALLDDQEKEEVAKSWANLYGMNPAGVVFLDIQRDIAPRAFVNKTLTPFFSTTPSMVVSAKQARPLHTQTPDTKMKLVVEGSAGIGTIQSIQCKLQGKKPDTVLICAHHDTHSLTPGATDNAAGVAIMLELARILAPQYTNLSYQFVSFGGEELGMKGSWAFVSEVGLEDIRLCINLDSIGELPGMLLALTAGSDEMVNWVSNIAKKNEYPATCRRTATTGGDNKVFAANGIPTIHLASYGTTTGKVSHSFIDDTSLLTPFTIGELGKFAYAIIDELETSEGIPFNLEVPDDLVRAAKQRILDTRKVL
ncbi:MAG: DUF4910 domain-containing protein [Candidatus Thorarchaeota archaeon]|jgi:hypothetical protein